MPITWKSGHRFKPSVILKQIEKYRSFDADGRVSFADFDIYDDAPALESMLNFPDAASDMNKSSLVWSALGCSNPELNPANFIAAINSALTKQLSKRDDRYHLLTTISVRREDWPNRITALDTPVIFLNSFFPKKYKNRDDLIARHNRFSPFDQPTNYCPIKLELDSKSPERAVHKAMKRIDLLRGILNLIENTTMQISFGGAERGPINAIVLGGVHTLHKADGSSAYDGLWVEPYRGSVKPHALKDAEHSLKFLRTFLGRIERCKFGDSIADALIRYARAFDEPDPNTAFLKLWAALELLVTPGVANYDKLVDRCSFLFDAREYHRQILLHLREYRNRSVHPSEEVRESKIHCYQLQFYFKMTMMFMIRSSGFFNSLDEANDFLSYPQDSKILKRRAKLIAKAVRFVGPS